MRGGGEAGRWLATRIAMAALLAIGIFALDVLSPLQGAVAVLYTTVVLVVARMQRRALVHATGIVCAVLAVLGYWISHGGEGLGSPAMRLAVSLIAIATTALMIARLSRLPCAAPCTKLRSTLMVEKRKVRR